MFTARSELGLLKNTLCLVFKGLIKTDTRGFRLKLIDTIQICFNRLKKGKKQAEALFEELKQFFFILTLNREDLSEQNRMFRINS